MEELYGFHAPAVYSMETQPAAEINVLSPVGNYIGFPSSYPEHVFGSGQGQTTLLSGSSGISDADSMVADEIQRAGGSAEEVSSAIRAKIASHPLYPTLLQAYIDCYKVC